MTGETYGDDFERYITAYIERVLEKWLGRNSFGQLDREKSLFKGVLHLFFLLWCLSKGAILLTLEIL